MHRVCAVALVMASSVLVARSAAAQSPSSLSFEGTVGVGLGATDGDYGRNRSGIAADVLLATRIRPTAQGSLVIGVNASAQGSGDTTLECRPASSGGCVPIFPSFFTVGPSVGWESRGGPLRAMIGPSLVLTEGGERTLGVQGRLDVAALATQRLAVIASVRPTVIPSYRGDPIGLLAFGIGLRLR